MPRLSSLGWPGRERSARLRCGVHSRPHEPPAPPLPSPAAVAAFLRGLDRRARLFAATQAAGLSTLLGSFLDEIVVDVPDKIITLIVVYFVLKGLPRKLTALYDANAKIEHLE